MPGVLAANNQKLIGNNMITKQTKKNKPAGLSLIETSEALSLSPSEVLNHLNTSEAGLTASLVEERFETFGPNEIIQRVKVSSFIKFLSHFKSPLTIILVIAAIISAVLHDITDASIILFIVSISVILDFTQENRAERAAEQLRKRVATTTTVIRDGQRQEIEVSQVVPGDIVALTAGDIIPADARILSARDFFIDQSALTGESYPIEKTGHPLKLSRTTDITEWKNYLFMGTSVTNGTATAVVINTGSTTEYGEIARKISQTRSETEFDRSLRRFGFLIVQVTFVLVIIVFLINALFKSGGLENRVLESALFAVALAVGLTPELLPMILSVNLSSGATKMSKKGVIVKRLSAIQNFGSMDVLCSDKTGTLTENRVTVILHVDPDGNNSEKVFIYSLLNSRYQTGLKSSLDEAIIRYKEVNTDSYKRVDEIPYDFVRKRLSVVVDEGQNFTLITKGAPEEIAGIITRYESGDSISEITDDIQAKIERQYRELSSRGFRVLGVCYRNLIEKKTVYAISDEQDMIFLGFIAFMDPLKPTAGESIALLRQAGVKLKVLTGDNEIVASHIGHQLGFQIYQARRSKRFDEQLGMIVQTSDTGLARVVRSDDIANMNDDVLAKIVERADIFTRVTPAQKSRIMNALKANGHVVGFIGDGINDTPSMKVADVSISVANAVDIAKESADIILLSNDLKIIRDGVIEGRKTFGNTMKYIMMAISSNFGNMISAAVASLFLNFLPMLPVQLLLNNLLYSFGQLTIPTDNVDAEYINRPQRLVTSFIRNFMIVFGPISSIFDFLTFFFMLVVFKASPPLFQTAWFVESLFTQTLIIFAIRTRSIPFFKSKPSKLLVINIGIILVIAAVLPFVLAGRFFHFVPLPVSFLLLLLGFIIVYLVLVEIVKRWFYKQYG